MRRARIPRAFRTGAAGLLLGLVAPAAGAHDVWLEPTSFRPAAGETIGVDVVVGERFRGEAVRRRPERIEDFWFGDGRARQPVRGVAGAAPAGVLRLEAEASGWRVVRYVSRPATIELSAERFERHLRHEGLERVLDLEPWRQRSSAAVREVYSRCVAALVMVGRSAVGGEAEHLPPPPDDCPLTLWPTTGPAPGRTIELEVRKDGRPLAGALVRAYRRGTANALEGRTDGLGRVELPGLDPGVWLVKTVHLEPPAAPAGDWRSWWVTLTFELTGG